MGYSYALPEHQPAVCHRCSMRSGWGPASRGAEAEDLYGALGPLGSQRCAQLLAAQPCVPAFFLG